MQEDKDIQQEAPLLFGLEKSSVEIPDAYLDGFEEDIISSVHLKKKVTMLFTIHPIAKWMAAACIFLIMGPFCADQMFDDAEELHQAALSSEIELTAEELDEYVELDDDIVMEVYLETVQEIQSLTMEYLIEHGVWHDDLLIEL
jgi:hypothetical protein